MNDDILRDGKTLVIRAAMGHANLKVVVSDSDQDEDRCFACGQRVQYDYRKRGQEAADVLYSYTSPTWLWELYIRLGERLGERSR